MSPEASRQSLQLALSRARLVQPASVWFFQILLSPSPHGRLFPFRFAPIRRLARGATFVVTFVAMDVSLATLSPACWSESIFHAGGFSDV
jgi:hypothetical protein